MRLVNDRALCWLALGPAATMVIAYCVLFIRGEGEALVLR